MRTSEKYATISAALARVQKTIPAIQKTKGVKVDGEKAKWESKYAPLSVLDEAVRGPLQAENIAMVEGMRHEQGIGVVLVTRLVLGEEWLEVDVPIKPSRDGAQGFGGGYTFARRWTLCALFNLVPDDVEEGQGYRDARAETRPPRRAAAPAGLAAVLDGIRTATSAERFEAAARAARAAHPSGEQANAVEGVITARMVASIDAAKEGDKLTELHDLNARLLPKGGEVRQAFQRAEQRIGVGR